VVEVRNKQKRETEQNSSGLRPGGDGADRRHVAPRAQHAEGHGFVGSGNKPVALSPEAVDEIMRNMEAARRSRSRSRSSSAATRCA